MKKLLIKDAVHGSIVLNPLEERVLDTPHVQRLRKVHQLALTYLVYPGACHTRFEHSLGTLCIAGMLSESLGIDEDERQAIRLAALLHDIGHPAFSHKSEDVFIEMGRPNHEHYTVASLAGALRDVLSEAGYLSRVRSLLSHGTDIVNGDIGADRMDYLVRDAHYTGVAYGIIDIDRLVKTVVYRKKKLYVTRRSLESAESLFIARFLMFSSVYYHHTVRIAGAMLKEALRAALREGTLTFTDLLTYGDEEILFLLRDSPLIQRLRVRHLYKRAYEVPVTDVAEGKRLLCEFRTILGAENGNVVIDFPASFVEPPKIFLWDETTGEHPLSSVSPLVASLRDRLSLIVACDEYYKRAVARECKKILRR